MLNKGFLFFHLKATNGYLKLIIKIHKFVHNFLLIVPTGPTAGLYPLQLAPPTAPLAATHCVDSWAIKEEQERGGLEPTGTTGWPGDDG